MKIKCHKCDTIIEIEENEYEKNVTHSVDCPLCYEPVNFTISDSDDKPNTEKMPENVTASPGNSNKPPKNRNGKNKPSQENKQPTLAPQPTPAPQPTSAPQPTPAPQTIETRNSGNGLKSVVWGILIVVMLVGGYIYYNNVYLPDKIDKEAPRYYTFIMSLVMRSSKMAGVDYNKLCSLPYGTELITYKIDPEWAEVKLKVKDGDDVKGNVASVYLLPKADFFLLNSIFGNTDAQQTINTAKCRLALLNYYKKNNYIGVINDEMREFAGIETAPTVNNQWQVFTAPKDAKLNNVFYKRLVNPNSKFTDFAFVVKNVKTGSRKLVYYRFDDDETPRFVTEMEAPGSGYIKNISAYYDYSDNINFDVTYRE